MRPTHGVCALLLVTANCHALELRQADGQWIFGSDALEIALDGATGALVELRNNGTPFATSPAGAQLFDLREEAVWLTGDRREVPELIEVAQPTPVEIIATIRLAQWRLAFHYELHPDEPLLTRWVDFTYQGEADTKIKGLWLGLPHIALSPDAQCLMPGNYPPVTRTADDLGPGSRHSTGRNGAPMVLQHSAGESIVFLSDELTPASDRASLTATGRDDGLEVTQGFDVQGWVRPGETQSVGAACLWLVPGDANAALLRIHDLMAIRGQRVPSDRPGWLEKAVLYSFHPGGTIGSGFTDLGGFAAATEALPSVAELGCDAIWVMPIEDASVYWPRDYYKFQDGLGSPEEYRALVARAHDLQIQVLQDCVPHGGANTYPRALEHPEWLAYAEDGSTFSYWCYDFNWPTWRAYMADVARHYVTQFGVDGFRVDAVGGSRIPNWNTDIPYDRASHAQLQGGLNMLRSLREAVKDEKPDEGALLAEVEGYDYGTTSDAVYDFTMCYSVLRDLRRLPPDEFVQRLSRWLHEQQYSEIPGLLRLRHVESHDSLRSELLYGIEARRALLALTAWIHGLLLVYHDMERGSEAQFRWVFDVRHAIPELNGGDADYVSVSAPPGVFACLRTKDGESSVVAINFNPESVEGEISLPASEGIADVAVCNARGGDAPARTEGGRLAWPLSVEPYGYTVFSLRPEGTEPPFSPTIMPTELAPEGPAAAPLPDAEDVLHQLGDYGLWLDRTSGLPLRIERDGVSLIDEGELLVGGAAPALAGPPQIDARPESVTVTLDLGASKLIMRYDDGRSDLHVEAGWEGGTVPPTAALLLRFPNAENWAVDAAEGSLRGPVPNGLRPGGSSGGGIYWREQKPNVLYDSLLHPLGPDGRQSALSAGTDSDDRRVRFGSNRRPVRAQWLMSDWGGLAPCALLSWSDPDVPGPSASVIAFDLRGEVGPREASEPTRETRSSHPALTPMAGGYLIENDSYRVRLSRSGMIVRLETKGEDGAVFTASDLYTDRGFHAERTMFSAVEDVEAACRIDRNSDGLHLIFRGRLRGSGRFDLLSPPVTFGAEYAFGSGPSFRASWGVLPAAEPSQDGAFLSTRFILGDVDEVRMLADGRALGQATVVSESGRKLQTSERVPPLAPDAVELLDDGACALRMSDLSYVGGDAANVFIDGRQLFLAWLDGEPPADMQHGWRWISCLMTPGDAAAIKIGDVPELSAALEPSILADGGFESSSGSNLIGLRTRRSLQRRSSASAWTTPSGGRVVAQPTHTGAAAALVVGQADDYRLYHQPLSLDQLEPGTTWRLSAWVKGEGIVRGDPAWKIGTLRFATAQGNEMLYTASEDLEGDFDWREVSAMLTIPPDATTLAAEVGLNGCAGRIWIDDVALERVPGPE